MRRLRPLLLAALLALAGPAFAITLDEAKDQGVIGEQPDGYLGVVRPPASPEVAGLVESVNARRRARYETIAADNGIEVRQVELLAGKKAIERTADGHWVRLPDGSWVPK
jgi:uncharacterized protein YdbL (DUF1318 family)